MSIVTRFAPSPTGYIHVGNLRTAIFAWLHARHNNGKFLVRVEDTDKERSTPDAIRAILEGLDWMGLKSDEPITFQSRNKSRHVEVANRLLGAGHAYRDYTTEEEMAKLKEDHRTSGVKGPFRYDSPYRDMPIIPLDKALHPFTIRLKAPRSGATTIYDLVQGEVTVQNRELDDFIILRSDGTPTYMLAAVVDDHDSGVTHVIRGDDHLNNAFRQLPIYRAMNWPEPTYAHLPLIHGEDGKKLSKRNGAPGLDDYQARGILPEALFNYLLRLGWGHADDEIITREQAIEWFDIKDVNRAPARVNEKRLRNLSSHYIKTADDDRLLGLMTTSHFTGEQIRPALPVLKMRASNLVELKESTHFIFATRPIPIEDDARPELDGKVLEDMEGLLASCIWEQETISALQQKYIEDTGVTMKVLAGALRVALTGRKTSPPTTNVMLLLGKDQTLLRIKDAINA